MHVACCIANNNLICHTTGMHEFASVVCSLRLTAALLPIPSRLISQKEVLRRINRRCIVSAGSPTQWCRNGSHRLQCGIARTDAPI